MIDGRGLAFFSCYVGGVLYTMVLRGLAFPKSGVISNLLWLVFALSFIWFPYFGMITLPCRRGQSLKSQHTQPWSAYPGQTVSIDYSQLVPVSNKNATISEVLKDQKTRLAAFCSSRNMPTTVYNEAVLQDLYHHILVDDERKLLFCYIPKVGCSNWKRVFLILAGVVDPNQKSRPSVDVFRQVNSLERYSPKEQEVRLRKYFKFMFVRHPPERILSAYRNKIEHPLNTNPIEQSIWDEVRYSILNSYRLEFNNKIATGTEVYPSFSEFIHFLYDSDPALMNEHYKPMVELCQPCAVNYDYFGDFAELRQDADAILKHLGINTSVFWDRGKHVSHPTQEYVKSYYSKLQPADFRRLEERYADDIMLYNHLFPFENDGGYSTLRKLL